jgi:peptide-methionine (S)-S-oxide reductase
MNKTLAKIGLGGGCHWCTEAVFLSLKGVVKVEQGFIAQQEGKSSFSEAIIVTYRIHEIGLKELIEVHLYTHKSTSAHSMRNKYRSAVYAFDEVAFNLAESYLKELQSDFEQKLITKVYYFKDFKYSRQEFHNYFYSNPEKPFCNTYIKPKLRLLLQKFSKLADNGRINSYHEST